MKFVCGSSCLWLVMILGCDGDPAQPMPVPGQAGPIVTGCGAREETFTNLGGGHVTGDLMYDDPPPVAGPHNPNWARWGVHAEAVPDQCFVHNLEHGGVVFLYNCPEGCPDEVAEMAAFVEGRTWALLTPYDSLTSKFAVVSWGHRITSDCLDMEAFEAFYTANVDHGPESLPIQPSTECK
jgi:Protein of unknown function (DUF3105)